RNTTQVPMDGNIYDTPPVIFVPADEDAPRWDALQQELPAAHEKLDVIAARADVAGWLDSKQRREWTPGAFDPAETLRVDAETDGLRAATGVRLRKGAIELGKEGWVQADDVKPARSG